MTNYNARSMSGIYNGCQAHIKKVAPYAEYLGLPCVAHLVGQSAVDCVPAAGSFFDTVEALYVLYVFFSGPTSRWEKLNSPVKSSPKRVGWRMHTLFAL